MTSQHPQESLRLASPEGGFQSIPWTRIQAVHFKPAGGMADVYDSVSAKEEAAQTLLRQIDFQHPLTTDAKPGAIITGTLTVLYTRADKQQDTRTFRLLGTTLLQDTSQPRVYYHASAGLQTCLEKR
jgi:hypothetical protein